MRSSETSRAAAEFISKRATKSSAPPKPKGAAPKAKRNAATKRKEEPRVAAKAILPSGGKSQITQVAAGILHEVPADLHSVLTADTGLLATWNGLTPIQRNEWICWVTIVKKPETRVEHVARLRSELREGKRQPCCWPGCPHRRPKAKKWFGMK